MVSNSLGHVSPQARKMTMNVMTKNFNVISAQLHVIITFFLNEILRSQGTLWCEDGHAFLKNVVAMVVAFVNCGKTNTGAWWRHEPKTMWSYGGGSFGAIYRRDWRVW